MTATEFTVIVPTYNGERTLGACLDSLMALDSESPARQIIVVDNGSTDRTVDIVRRYPSIELLFELDRRGAAAARNTGARHARGRFLAFIDQDVIVNPQWLAAASKAFGPPDVVIAGGPVVGVPAKNRVQEWMNDRRILDQSHSLNNPFMPYLQTANAMFRRDAFDAVEGFDEALAHSGEDTDLCWRVLEKTGGRIAYADGMRVAHDHRATVRGMFRQSVRNAKGSAYMRAHSWADRLPAKRAKQSLWECCDIARALWRCVGAAGEKGRALAWLDLVHRIGRKWGMIQAAWETRQWREW